jgi:hypothetical protein
MPPPDNPDSPEIPEIFETYIMPISGTDFVKYIAFISHIAEILQNKFNRNPFIPKTIYCASGGCLVAYIALMSDFTSNVENWYVGSEMFIRKPTPFTPRLLTFILNGFLYHRTDAMEHLKKLFIPRKLLNVEIVTGYYEKGEECNRIHIVTNRDKENSAIKNLGTNLPTNTTVLKYADDLPAGFYSSDFPISERKAYLNKLMFQSIEAMQNTSNIPYLTGPRGIENALDYGIVSPTTRILTNAPVNKGIYFSPIDCDLCGAMDGYEMIFHKFILNDIISLQNTFSKRIDLLTFEKVIEYVLLSNLSRYCLIIFTPIKVDLKVYDFSFSEVKRLVSICKTALKFRLLYDNV